MAGNEQSARPLSPHLQVYHWSPAMTVSILHRISGDGLAIVGTLMLLWWIGAIAGGADSYAAFLACVWHDPAGGTFHLITNILGKIVLIGLTWALFQHLFSGLRHLVLDTGAGYELGTNRRWALAVALGAPLVTAVLWALIFTGVL